MNESAIQRVDLDGSEVVEINRDSNQLLIDLDQKRDRDRKLIRVSVKGNYSESAAYYVGLNVTKPHPNPNFPLDFIEYAELGPSHLELGGYLNGESWYVWRIKNKNIEITEVICGLL